MVSKSIGVLVFELLKNPDTDVTHERTPDVRTNTESKTVEIERTGMFSGRENLDTLDAVPLRITDILKAKFRYDDASPTSLRITESVEVPIRLTVVVFIPEVEVDVVIRGLTSEPDGHEVLIEEVLRFAPIVVEVNELV